MKNYACYVVNCKTKLTLCAFNGFLMKQPNITVVDLEFSTKWFWFRNKY